MGTDKVIISLFDYTGGAVRPWAEAGYDCYCLDIQHPMVDPCIDADDFLAGRMIWKAYADLSAVTSAAAALQNLLGDDWRDRVAFVFGWPPCTDLASSGARHWSKKREANPDFQTEAVRMARVVEYIGIETGAPYVIENPTGALSTLWRRPDHRFDPCDFGGYIPEADAEHPKWPEFIPPRDAYQKRTCYWVGNGFVMPEARRVEPEVLTDSAGNRGSRQWKKLGGKSLKTKNIRSATPRGISRAIFEANAL